MVAGTMCRIGWLVLAGPQMAAALGGRRTVQRASLVATESAERAITTAVPARRPRRPDLSWSDPRRVSAPDEVV